MEDKAMTEDKKHSDAVNKIMDIIDDKPKPKKKPMTMEEWNKRHSKKSKPNYAALERFIQNGNMNKSDRQNLIQVYKEHKKLKEDIKRLVAILNQKDRQIKVLEFDILSKNTSDNYNNNIKKY